VKDKSKKVLSIQKQADRERDLRLRRITQQVVIFPVYQYVRRFCRDQAKAETCRAIRRNRNGTVELIFAI